MIEICGKSCLHEGQWREAGPEDTGGTGTLAQAILAAHQIPGRGPAPCLRFDALASHDITYVGVVQTARAGGMLHFPLPYALSNCHNSLCAVGGTINEDDHQYGLSAAVKYGGDFVPPHLAVIHQYVRETLAGCGGMILGSDSHTRYGALGCMGIGEGGPELVKQLLGQGYDMPSMPETTAVWLHGVPRPGVGSQDVALALIQAVFSKNLVKNNILEFVGPGAMGLSVDFRLGIDVMTTESACLSSIWQTDEKVRRWLEAHGRGADYKELKPAEGACYSQVIKLNLSQVKPMIALPFHPSNTCTIENFLANAEDLLAGVEKEVQAMTGVQSAGTLRAKLRDGGFYADQGIVAGCSGGLYENLVQITRMLRGKSIGAGPFDLSVYPASQPQYLALMKNGCAAALLEAGVSLKTAFCGPCFGASDAPAHNAFSIRHVTRNFPHREGSRPSDGQMAYVALMDARSIAATALNQGRLTPADALEPVTEEETPYSFDPGIYAKRVYRGFGKARPEHPLLFGPNIKDWPPMPPLPENLLLGIAAAIDDPVTTTDELIPSGETSSYRSNPLRLAEFTLSRKDPAYVGRAKTLAAWNEARRNGNLPPEARLLWETLGISDQEGETGIGSLLFARKPGDGSAREQAASCQKVLGGWANLAVEYATKRYRSNLVNWGLLPLEADDARDWKIQPGDFFFLPGIRTRLAALPASGGTSIAAVLLQKDRSKNVVLHLPELTAQERNILVAGCLMNYYALVNSTRPV